MIYYLGKELMMKKAINEQQRNLIQKLEALSQAGEKLKKEFMGIDQVIDEVISSVSSWYLFPEFQEKPVVINLWGLTGVGKTSLVKQLFNYLSFENRFFHFDLGENDKRSLDIKSDLESFYESNNGTPAVFAFDEFQHARTLDGFGNELDKTSSRIVWQLLDTGQFQIFTNQFEIESIHTLILKLKYLLREGVKVSKGKVCVRREYFEKMMDLDEDSGTESESRLFVPKSYQRDIYDLSKEDYSGLFDVADILSRLNGPETINFLMKVFEKGSAPKTIDCSKAIVFVMGNIDEAYSMSDDYDPDMDADEFHKQSLRIGVMEIKKALKVRFRNEQIARLGNTHIIYRAFSKHTFERIIKAELDRIAEKVFRHQGVNLVFDQSVRDLIYNEGVYPTQGTRPVFSTIHQVINSHLGEIIAEAFIKDFRASRILIKAKDEYVVAEYHEKETLIESRLFKSPARLGKLRSCKHDDMQTISAVHESGHAIISVILLKTLPEVIYSNSTSRDRAGFVFANFVNNYVSRKDIPHRLAFFLGGFAAEMIIFGEENVTTGANNDIEKATGFLLEMLKESGMGNSVASYWEKSPDTRNHLHDEAGTIDMEAEALLKSALELSLTTLRKQEELLLKMADYLSDHRKMVKQQILEYVNKYAVGLDEKTLIINSEKHFYRQHLKQKVQCFNNSACPISLNNQSYSDPLSLE